MVNLTKNDSVSEGQPETTPLLAKIKSALPEPIEILIIVLIIAIIAAIALPVFLKQAKESRELQERQQVNACQLADDRGETLPEGCAQ